MSRTTNLSDFTDRTTEKGEDPAFRESCSAEDCNESVGPLASLCIGCASHKRRSDGEPVGREDGYSPDEPECAFCGRPARPSDDPRTCRQCGGLDASEVIR